MQRQHGNDSSLGDAWQTDGEPGIVDDIDVPEHPNPHTTPSNPIVLQITSRSARRLCEPR